MTEAMTRISSLHLLEPALQPTAKRQDLAAQMTKATGWAICQAKEDQAWPRWPLMMIMQRNWWTKLKLLCTIQAKGRLKHQLDTTKSILTLAKTLWPRSRLRTRKSCKVEQFWKMMDNNWKGKIMWNWMPINRGNINRLQEVQHIRINSWLRNQIKWNSEAEWNKN